MVPAPPPSSLDGSGNAMSPCPVREGGPRLLSLRILLCGLPFEEARRGGLCRGEGCDHSTDPYGSVWISTGQYGSVRISTDQYGSVRISMDQYGSVRISTDQYGSVRISTDWYGSVRISTNQYGSVRIGTHRYGSVRISTGIMIIIIIISVLIRTDPR